MDKDSLISSFNANYNIVKKNENYSIQRLKCIEFGFKETIDRLKFNNLYGKFIALSLP